MRTGDKEGLQDMGLLALICLGPVVIVLTALRYAGKAARQVACVIRRKDKP